MPYKLVSARRPNSLLVRMHQDLGQRQASIRHSDHGIGAIEERGSMLPRRRALEIKLRFAIDTAESRL